jgi:hypothetical protein
MRTQQIAILDSADYKPTGESSDGYIGSRLQKELTARPCRILCQSSI